MKTIISSLIALSILAAVAAPASAFDAKTFYEQQGRRESLTHLGGSRRHPLRPPSGGEKPEDGSMHRLMSAGVFGLVPVPLVSGISIREEIADKPSMDQARFEIATRSRDWPPAISSGASAAS